MLAGRTHVAIALSIGAALLTLLGRARIGFLIGCWLVAVLDGIPGYAVSYHLQDTLVAVAIVLLLVSHLLSERKTSWQGAWITRYAVALGAWWLIVWLRSFLIEGIPPFQAFLFGRDFLDFAILLPLVTSYAARHKDKLPQAAIAVGFLTAIYALAQIAASLAHAHVAVILHSPTILGNSSIRIFSPMNGLVRLSFVASVAAVWGVRDRVARVIAVMGTVIYGMAVLLQETRAAYLGLGAAFFIGAVIWSAPRGVHLSSVRRRILATAASALVAAGVLLLVARGLALGVAQRVTEGVSNLQQSTGTAGHRLKLGSEMLSLLGTQWPVGLGFLNPATHFIVGLPGGSIRNTDLGVLNSLMTMGVIGTVLLYLPVLRTIQAIGRAHARGTIGAADWWRMGICIWLISIVISSLTLVDLFTVPGLVLAAGVIAVAIANPLAEHPHES